MTLCVSPSPRREPSSRSEVSLQSIQLGCRIPVPRRPGPMHCDGTSAHQRRTTPAAASDVRCRKSSEPCSGTSRTGLRRTKTEIGKWRPETAALKPAAGGLEFEDCRPETSAWNPNLRKCRSFSQTGKPNHRDPTGWLTRQSLANWSGAANSLLTEKFTGTPSILIHLHANAREQHPLIQ